jgi:hypothetical protein
MSSSKVREELVALAWSLWAELGVSGWERRHKAWFVDPEPLVIFTAWLGDQDARLRDEVTDWCIRFGSWISATRLANMLRANESAAERFGELAATVARHSTLRWRGATSPRPYEPSLKSQLVSFDSPSLVSLRLRALLGVGARAEILRQFLSSGSLAQSASDLVEDAGFMKRNVADALDAFRLGGVLDSTRTQNKLAYRLRQPVAWRTLLGELPSVWPRWSSIFPLLSRASDAIDHMRAIPARSATVEANKTARGIVSLVERAHLYPLPSARGHEHGPEAFEDWTLRTAAALARGRPHIFVGAAEST